MMTLPITAKPQRCLVIIFNLTTDIQYSNSLQNLFIRRGTAKSTLENNRSILFSSSLRPDHKSFQPYWIGRPVI